MVTTYSANMILRYFISYKNSVYWITCSANSTRIEASYQCKRIADMKEIIRLCRAKGSIYPQLAIQYRSMAGMVIEWRAHNLLYALGIRCRRSRSVSFDYPRKWYAKIGYFALSCVYLRY